MSEQPRTYVRVLACPCCSALVNVASTGDLPETLVIPDHAVGPKGGNLCQGFEVKVSFDLVACGGCGARMLRHPIGLCMKCFSRRNF